MSTDKLRKFPVSKSQWGLSIVVHGRSLPNIRTAVRAEIRVRGGEEGAA